MVRDNPLIVNQVMQVPKHIFKAYDIRGLVEKEITEDFAYHLGKATATLHAKENEGEALTIVVGHDMRDTSKAFQAALMKGLVECGVRVLDIGLVSTPAYYYAVGALKAHGGLSVTASHNPSTYNGFKMTRSEARPLGGNNGFEELVRLMETEEYMEASEPGAIEVVEDIPGKSVEAEMAYAGADPVAHYKIVIDTGNGMGAQYFDELFKRVDADITRMYWEMDGTFPNHESNPIKEETLEDIKAKVKEVGADLGIATDGDGDRIFFIDNTGKTVEPAIIRGMLAEIMLRTYPGATICYDIRPGKITEDLIKENGGNPSLTPVGHSLIKAQMRKENAMFGGESSGHFYYNFDTGTYDGPVTACMQIMQEMTRIGKPLSEIVAPHYRYAHSGEINYEVEDKVGAMERLKAHFSEGEINEMDGVTVTYDTFWFNVRPSNTEPLLRLNLEAVDQETMESKRDEVAKIIQET